MVKYTHKYVKMPVMWSIHINTVGYVLNKHKQFGWKPDVFYYIGSVQMFLKGQQPNKPAASWNINVN